LKLLATARPALATARPALATARAVIATARPALAATGSAQRSGRRRAAGSVRIGCSRPSAHQQLDGRTRTSQCRSWRQCERRYGHRACRARSMRGSSQTNDLMSI
jgi:hypothetical protein